MTIDIFNKNVIFISSTGRTGTQFLAKVMSMMIDNCTSFHEPGTPWLTKPKKLIRQIRRYGLYHMTVGQVKPTHSIYKLSADRVSKRVVNREAKEYIKRMRKDLIANVNEEIYLESSGHLYGVLDLLDDIFSNSKFVFIIRDPRRWIKSALNTLEYTIYGPMDPSFLKLSIKASDFAKDSYFNKWDKMSKFEKYCWYYNKLNSYVFNKMEGRDNFKVYRHEDLFHKDRRDEFFVDMLSFVSKFPDDFNRNYEYKRELMDKKVHSNAKKEKISDWQEWSSHLAKKLDEHCGEWMERFNYGTEDEWQDKLI